MSLNENKYIYTLNCNFAQEMWDTIKIIYEVSLIIEQEGVNTWGEKVETQDECEGYFHKWC